ncbi:MSMEG_6728 family protein [Nocardiopsis halotolerans]|uniref:MSMEG_6728 family protein n=1 Tax=Nocardiopsis halotolerans TaxID=124252 RepID=UPI00034A83FB|nr:MSMEG_6728 family protein [Nocardiopsis halotolerans]
MQTFLPHAAFSGCARALDDRRLGKQRVETMQILRALVWPEYGWKRHPAVAMWRGFVPALVGYGVAVCREWRRRGYADAVLPSLLAFSGGRVPEEEWLWEHDLLPPWLGDEELHVSHRSALVGKDGAYYGPLFPGTPRGLPYVWPRPVFPRWPLRRGGAAPLTPGEGLEAVAADSLTDEQAHALERLVGGRDASLRLTAPGDTVPGLLAGLCTPGETLWLVPGCPPPRPEGVVDPGPLGAVGRTSGSTARQPRPEDEAAMREEGREPEFRFRRVAPGSGPEVPVPSSTGLVVLDGAALPEPRSAPLVLRLLPAERDSPSADDAPPGGRSGNGDRPPGSG